MKPTTLIVTLAAAAFSIAAPLASRGEPSSFSAHAAAGEEVAMIVSPKTPVDNVSSGDLKKILMGDRQFWEGSQRITLLIRAPVALERDILLRKVYKMTEAQFRQYWVAKVFRADAPSGPKVVYSNQTAFDLVAGIQGAVAFVKASEIPKGAKVVKIDGLAPGDKGYPLQ